MLRTNLISKQYMAKHICTDGTAGKLLHNVQGDDIGHCPIPAHQPLVVGKGRVYHLIHQSGIDGNNEDE